MRQPRAGAAFHDGRQLRFQAVLAVPSSSATRAAGDEDETGGGIGVVSCHLIPLKKL
jgi:hypothetical protein